MDNLTHSLAALAVAELAIEKTGTQRQRRLLWAGSLIANNFPDLDILYAGGKLGYLVHHRGHTHTLLLGIPQSLAVLAMLWGIARWRKWEPSAHDWRVAAFLVFLGPVLHISLDYLNSYGVHPFWPFSNRWYYGDAVFIVEPWLWGSFAPALWSPDASRRRTIFAIFFTLAAPIALWVFPFVAWYAALGVTLWTFAVACLAYRSEERALWSIGAAAAVIGLFLGVSRYIKRDFPSPVVDLVLTPAPANPLCWSMLAIRTEGGDYLVRRGVYAPFPKLRDASRCEVIRIGAGDAPMREVPPSDDPRIRWTGEYQASRKSVVARAERHCGFETLLRFARVPFVLESGETFIGGDLRYDFEEGSGFAEIEFKGDENACTHRAPPWKWPADQWLRP